MSTDPVDPSESPLLKTIRAEIGRRLEVNAAGLTIQQRPALQSQSNRLYDVWAGSRHLITKEYLQPDELEVAPLREYKALQLLSPLDVAPQPFFFEPSAGPVVVYEYMEGQMWDRAPVSAADLSQLLEVWLKVNSVAVDWPARGFGRPLGEIALECQARLQTYQEWAAAEYRPGLEAAEMGLAALESRRAAFQELDKHHPAPCFCRSDPRFANVIRRPGSRLGLVDWEDSGLRDPARELADFVYHPNQEDLLTEQAWVSFIQPYLGFHSRIDVEVEARFRLYLAVFPLFWMSILVQRATRLAASGQLQDWQINGLPGNERLRRYLARALCWPEPAFTSALNHLERISFFPEF